MKSLLIHALLGDLPYAKDRRSLWPRILGWVAAWACWIPLVALWLVCNSPVGGM